MSTSQISDSMGVDLLCFSSFPMIEIANEETRNLRLEVPFGGKGLKREGKS